MNTGSDNPLTKAELIEEESSLESRFLEVFVNSAWRVDAKERCEGGERDDCEERCCDSERK